MGMQSATVCLQNKRELNTIVMAIIIIIIIIIMSIIQSYTAFIFINIFLFLLDSLTKKID